MTIQSIDVTTDLPESRERAVLLEMLKVVPLLKAEGVDAVILRRLGSVPERTCT
jgi:hypothetical protein